MEKNTQKSVWSHLPSLCNFDDGPSITLQLELQAIMCKCGNVFKEPSLGNPPYIYYNHIISLIPWIILSILCHNTILTSIQLRLRSWVKHYRMQDSFVPIKVPSTRVIFVQNKYG